MSGFSSFPGSHQSTVINQECDNTTPLTADGPAAAAAAFGEVNATSEVGIGKSFCFSLLLLLLLL